jgi:hypothetical protein
MVFVVLAACGHDEHRVRHLPPHTYDSDAGAPLRGPNRNIGTR